MSQNLTEGPIGRCIASFALPYMAAYFLQVLYGLADLFVVGRYCGVSATTAVANGAQVMYMFTVIMIALSMGVTVSVAHAVGAGDKRAQGRCIGNTFLLFFVIAVAASAVMLALRDGIISAIDTPSEAVGETAEYLTITFAGIPFVVAYNVIASVFRGLGDTRRPMYFVAMACVANIILDFLFIGWLGMGPRGAALGTVLAQTLSVIAALLYLWRRRAEIGVRKSDFAPHWRTIGNILRVGIPVALQDGFIQLSFMIIMVIANGRGVCDAAAVGIVEKFIGVLFIVPSAMLATISAMAAQSFGAGKTERAVSTLRMTLVIAVGFGIVIASVLQLVPGAAVRIFTSDAAVIALGSGYLRGYVWDCVLAGVHFCFSGYFTASGRSYISFLHNFVAIVVARVPLAYWASAHYPDSLFPMGLATCAGSLLSALICVGVYIWLARRGDAFCRLSK